MQTECLHTDKCLSTAKYNAVTCPLHTCEMYEMRERESVGSKRTTIWGRLIQSSLPSLNSSPTPEHIDLD